MKNIINYGKKIMIILMFSLLTSGVAFAQNDPPPPPGGGGTGNTNTVDNQLGGKAHVGGGVLILLTLALAYGGKRFYDYRKNEKAEA